MRYSKLAIAFAFATGASATPGGTPVLVPRADTLELSPDAVQSGSFVDGSTSTGAKAVGQAKSLTSQNNFINNCVGKTLTNGLQITTGSCNGIPMGDIPAKTKMVSSIILFPTTGGKDIASNTDFTITVQMSNLVAGSFTNPDATYYAAPQTLSGGAIVGHTHVTVQDLGKSLNPTTALDPTKFAFFKGINDAGNGNGLLSASVVGGLPAGNYRVCTLASASNHQPVIMPVAQRGGSDDCTKFTVSGSGATENPSTNDGTNGEAAASAATSSAVTSVKTSAAAGNGNGNAAQTTTAAAATTTAKANGANGNGNAATTAVSKDNSAVQSATKATSAAAAATPASGNNVQTFKGTLGGAAPAVIFTAGADRPFSTDSSTFVNAAAALQRSCSVQHNKCADAANSGKLSGGQFQCETQINECNASISATKKRSVNVEGAFSRERRLRFAKRRFVV